MARKLASQAAAIADFITRLLPYRSRWASRRGESSYGEVPACGLRLRVADTSTMSFKEEETEVTSIVRLETWGDVGEHTEGFLKEGRSKFELDQKDG